jgi:DNA-binding response OmpR family regulator
MPGASARRVLLVDDDEAVREALSLLLRREGWDVTICSSVDEAESAFARTPCDVVLSDLVMPGRGAIELLGSLRRRDPRLAFVVMSGYLTDERFKELLQAGATDCLAKPLAADDLVRALIRAIVLRSSVDQRGSVVGEHAMVLTVPADLQQRAGVMAQVDVAAQAGGFDLRRNRILMALDEAFTNAVIHGAQGNSQLTIEVRASFSQHGGVVTVSDPGPGFDPVLTEMVADEAHRRRGLYLLRAACDDARWLGRGNVCQMLFRQPRPEDADGVDAMTTGLLPKGRRRGTSSHKLVAIRRPGNS